MKYYDNRSRFIFQLKYRPITECDGGYGVYGPTYDIRVVSIDNHY